MLDPNRYALNAETVGFRKRMGLSVPMDAFKIALQNQTDAIKVRRELEETPITEIHVMGGGMFGIATDEKTKTYARQQRQINGYVLRSFKANGGPIILPPKHGEGLLATPMNLGQRQYGGYNSIVGNYVSSFTEPLQAPLDNNTMLLAKAGIMASNESASNPYAKLQFLLNMQNTQREINENQAAFMETRQYNVQKDIAKTLREAESQEFSGSRKRRVQRQEEQGIDIPAGRLSVTEGELQQGLANLRRVPREQREQQEVPRERKRSKQDITATPKKLDFKAHLEQQAQQWTDIGGVTPAAAAYVPEEEKEDYVPFSYAAQTAQIRARHVEFAKEAGTKVQKAEKASVVNVEGAGNAQDIRSDPQILASSITALSKEQKAATDSLFARMGNLDGNSSTFSAAANNIAIASPALERGKSRRTSVMPGMADPPSSLFPTLNNTRGGSFNVGSRVAPQPPPGQQSSSPSILSKARNLFSPNRVGNVSDVA